MRDIGYLMGLIVFIFVFIFIGGTWYFSDIREDTQIAELNTLLRTASINQVSLTSRVEVGSVYMNQNGQANMSADKPDFETTILKGLTSKESTEGDVVRIDYITNDSSTAKVPATIYRYKPDQKKWIYTADAKLRPLKEMESVDAIRVRFRKAGHSANGNSDKPEDEAYWTYQSTVEVSRSKAVQELMESSK